jgi:hypothetical protein
VWERRLRLPGGTRLAFVLLVPALLAGCGSDSGSSGSASAAGTDQSTATGNGTKGSAQDPRAAEISAAVRHVLKRGDLNSAVYGVWVDGRKLVTGALGRALPGVPASTDMHFRIGNVTETITTTLLLLPTEEDSGRGVHDPWPAQRRGIHYSSLVLKRIAKILAPGSVPQLPARPRD